MVKLDPSSKPSLGKRAQLRYGKLIKLEGISIQLQHRFYAHLLGRKLHIEITGQDNVAMYCSAHDPDATEMWFQSRAMEQITGRSTFERYIYVLG